LLDVTARLAVTDPPAPPAAVTDPKSNNLIDLSSLVMDKGVVFDGYCNMMDKRDVVSLPSSEERRKSWQSGGRNKHQDRRPNREVALEPQPADLSAQ